jgi:broad specificity phosphatase PhoE
MAERTIYLVRHGQYSADKPSVDELGNGLSELGRQQAALTGQRLSALPITSITHSGLRRAQETAEIIAEWFPRLRVQSSALLRECTPCVPVGYEEKFAKYSPDMIARDTQQAQAALDAFFRPAVEGNHHDVLVCHGNIIRYFVLRALRAPVELWANTDVYNCGISEISVKPDGSVLLISHNDTGHLPYELRTFV